MQQLPNIKTIWSKTIPLKLETMIPQQEKNKHANQIVNSALFRVQCWVKITVGFVLGFFSISLLASFSLKDLMEWYISAMKQRAQSHELIVFEMTRLF